MIKVTKVLDQGGDVDVVVIIEMAKPPGKTNKSFFLMMYIMMKIKRL